MKQKIVIEVICKKRRSKAMALAATKHGVSSVSLDGQNPYQLVVVGDDVDAACLIEYLRKKVGQASLVTVEKIVEKVPEKKKDPPPACVCKVPPYCYQPPMGFCHGVYVEYPPGCNVCWGNGFHWPWY
ncbi:heavy metal-associated isoprenylated plant protein 47-like [Carya illinoinensis]|uniref:heavy metal-associated isoprenylated plant protein 47-like n=1 Tax=Carya illinoinensis TaxID=32201 RepID=UPI001C717EA6|nr:heavy metal-associated isoprenylated plant protein 47-like [Carya illinoinensis]